MPDHLSASFLEAAARGLPIITTRQSGIPDAVVHGHTGLSRGEDDADQFVDHLMYSASHPHLWCSFGPAGRRHVLERCNAQVQPAAQPRPGSGGLRQLHANRSPEPGSSHAKGYSLLRRIPQLPPVHPLR